ncbi:methionyl-tRNA formyltransferase [Mycolicibacterium canariasense]|uniref:Methionyl-tRNA formyltransferase n=1 Tax=Mycolicibacterium canariasense TaxID=228230 RepID=A0A100WAL9_MYCCR|nr:methionyl-tRNA formyltransferase [Mycolicibacterium canariasense]MCV7209477.1 methionyl-tRNA formyltransferase [Mycolicibacterium canariasense]ORV05725.1 methionyl-tRNA formyltransferase [Mycolicibacterium canariasense]GAS94987.1 methionyl-tRNA formyltransferase [Mycolicibacterium canariasense]
MRVAMFGYQTWGHKTLEALIKSPHEVVLVVTHPPSDQPYESIWADSVEELAGDHGIPVHLAQRPDAALIERVRDAQPDIMVANNWRTWLPRELFDLPRHGTLNLHDSLLPRFTGFSPVIWAMISGANEVGLTAHRMDDDLDTGDIVLQRSIPIGPTDTGTELVRATIDLIPEVLVESLDLIERGAATWTAQNLEERTFFHKRSARDSIIDWRWSAVELDRFVRALSDPYPNAVTYYRGERIRILKATVSRYRYGGTPGRVFIAEGDGMVIVTGADAHRGESPGLVIQRIRLDDGTELPALEYFGRGGGYLDDRP